MAAGQSLIFYIGLLLIGLVFMLLVWSLSRLMPKLRPSHPIESRPSSLQQHSNQHEAVLLIESGGRVKEINPLLGEWFNLTEEEAPNLERLARNVRPSEEFLKICAGEGDARFSINGRLTEGTSYRIPGESPYVLVTLRRIETSTGFAAESRDVSGSVLRIVSDFSQAIASSLNLEATVTAILENVERLVPSDFVEIKVWNSSTLVATTYRFAGTAGLDRKLEVGNESKFGGYSDYLIREKQVLFIPDTHTFRKVQFVPDSNLLSPVRSYLGIPLIAGGELVGTLEVGVLAAQAFAEEDKAILDLIVGQAAIALRNAVLYEGEQQRTAELLGLANLAQTSTGSLRDTRDLFGRLVRGLGQLFDVEIIGFLIYDENRHILAGQVPFQGLPPNVVQIYKVSVPLNGLVEQLLSRQESISTPGASDDPRWVEMDLDDIAQAASLRDTLLVPLVSGGRSLGFIQLSNHRSGTLTFSEEELRLITIVANQVAAIIENATLMQQSRQRAQRAEALRRIASLVNSSATMDEVLRYTVQEISHLLHADSTIVFLYEENQGLLRGHLPSAFGIPDDLKVLITNLFIDPVQYKETVTGSMRPFVSGRLSEDDRVLLVYRPIISRLQAESAIIVPLIVRDHGVGEIILASTQPDFFNNYDLQVMATAAGQVSSAVERAKTSTYTDENLRERVEHLNALSRVVREFNTAADTASLVQVVYDECMRISNADCGSVLLLKENYKTHPDAKIIEFLGEQAAGLLQIEKDSLETGDPIVIDDYSQSDYSRPHEEVRSGLCVPIAFQGQSSGVIHLHAKTKMRFDTAAVEITRTLAIQAAISFGNLQRLREQLVHGEQLHRRAETLSKLFVTSQHLGIEQSLEQALYTIALGIQEATPFDTVLLSVYEPETGLLRRVTGVGMTQETLEQLRSHQQPWKSVMQLIKPEFKFGEAYFIPYDQTPVIPTDVHVETIMPLAEGQTSPNAWNPDDFLLFPLNDMKGNPLGLVSLDSPRDRLRPDMTTIETVEVFAAQAGLTISSIYRVSELRNQVGVLKNEVMRQKDMVEVSQSHLPSLLHKDLEQTVSISHLDQRSRRIRAGLEITETISRQFDAASALQTLGEEVLTRFDMSVSIVAEDTPDGPRILHVMGNVPPGVNPEAIFGQRNPLRACLQVGEMILSENIDEDENWHDTPLLNALRAKSFISLPVSVDNKPVAAVLAVSFEPMPAFAAADRQVYFQISRQVSIILQNIKLLNETRKRLQEVNLLLDFSRQLSGLGPDSILNALLESALRVISSAHAGTVMIWNDTEERLIPRVASNYADNDSMMSISYGLDEGLPGRVFAGYKSLRVDEVNFATDYNLPPENLLKYRKATAGRLPVASLLIPIQTSERSLGLLVLDNFNTPSAFKSDDEALLLSLTQQVALSLENVRLVQATQERAKQLQALNDVASTISSSLNRDQLISEVLERFNTVIPYDTAILWLRDGNRMVVSAARGFADNEQRQGLSVAIEDSTLLKEMINKSKGISVADVRLDPRFPSLIEPQYLSWLGLPLISKDEVMGVIALEKAEPNFYTPELEQVGTTFASQSAVALENAALFEESVKRAAELDERSQRLALLNKFSSDLSGELNTDQVLRLAAEQLRQALDATRASVIAIEHGGEAFLHGVLPDDLNNPPEHRPLPITPLFDRLKESLGIFTSDDVASEPDLQPLAEILSGTRSLMILPIGTEDNLHVVFIQMDHFYHFSPAEMDLARTFSNQAGIALENAQLYQSTVATAERLTTLNQVSYQISGTLNPEDTYKAIHAAVERLMPLDAFVIAMLDEETNEVAGTYIVDSGKRITGVHMPIGQGLSGRVIASGEPLLTLDSVEADSRGAYTVGEKGTPHSIVAVPIFIGGRPGGMLSAQSYKKNAFNQNDLQILSTLANQASAAIQNGRLFAETQNMAATLEQRVNERTAELQREQRNTETLLRILTEVSASLDLDRALSRTLALLNDAIGAEQGTIMLLNVEDNTLQFKAGYGYASGESPTGTPVSGSKPFTLKVGEGLAGWVVKNRQPTLVEDLLKDSRWVVSPHSSSQHRSAIVAPLIVGEVVSGAIMVFHRKVGFFTEDALSMVQAIGSQVAISINNSQLYELIRDQAERLGAMLRSQQVEASKQTAILEAVADGVLVTDSRNQINFVNASAERILNIKSDNAMGQALEMFSGMFGKTTQTWIQTIHSWSENPAEHQPGDTYAEQITLEDGRVLLVHLAPVIWKKEFLGTVSIFRDITHEVEVDRLKSEFVATVSHELRTPMTSIRGYTDILLMGAAGALNDNQRHFLDIVKTNTERLNTLVNDLLDISRIEAGRVTLSLQALDMREIASDVVADVLRRAQEENKPMKVKVEAAKKLPRALGDMERVRQILGNLVDNAYHYSDANGQIIVHMDQKNGSVLIDVKDEGIGIPMEAQERVFDRFYRGEDALVLATPGTGLGLSIVKQLVEMHNGKIWLKSSGIPGQGSTFTFTLPVYQPEE
jgi:PAS domain S-box-containing protein